MTEKRFQIWGQTVKDTLGIIPFTLWQIKEQQQKYCDEMNKLHEENEQLKERNQELYDKLQVTMSKHSLQMGETELIKHIIQEAYETERTQIGKNVLKQLMEQIQ